MWNQQSQPSSNGGILSNFQIGWDAQTAAAVLVVGSLAFLIALRHGFGPLTLSVQ